jgi:S-adenosylmethionine:tRNA ribosyltransferase-isomerase
MKTSDFDYHLPQEFIAQTPVEPRDSSRLLVLDRSMDTIHHKRFYDLGEFLRPNDLLVLNETRVIPARLFARKIPTGGRVEILLLKQMKLGIWEALVGGKGLVPGKMLQVEGGPKAEVIEQLQSSRRVIRFEEPLDSVINNIGQMPLPPYIHEPLSNPDRYQTIYAKHSGSAAAPTAGLHFTPDLILQLEKKGVQFAYITLHVGLDTFAPVTEERPEEHEIHTEWCRVSEKVARQIYHTHANSGRVIAVGTTSMRSLESAARHAVDGQKVSAFEGPTDLFILPGFKFKVVDAMITNFHLPRSTLIMLVSAFAGRKRIMAAYDVAKDEGYQFYSFGDAMLII